MKALSIVWTIAGFLLWTVNALLLVLALVNVAIRHPEQMVPGLAFGAFIALTLILGGWVLLVHLRRGSVSRLLKVTGVIVGLLWALPASYGLVVNTDGLYLSVVPLLLGLAFIWSSLAPNVPKNVV